MIYLKNMYEIWGDNDFTIYSITYQDGSYIIKGRGGSTVSVTYKEAKRFETALVKAALDGRFSRLHINPYYYIDCKGKNTLANALPNVREVYRKYHLNTVFKSYEKFLENVCFKGFVHRNEKYIDLRHVEELEDYTKIRMISDGEIVEKSPLEGSLIDGLVEEFNIYTNKDTLMEAAEKAARKKSFDVVHKLEQRANEYEVKLNELRGYIKELTGYYDYC